MPPPLAIPIALGVAGLIGKGINYIKADSDQEKAQKALDKLSAEPFEEFKVGPELKSYASRVNSGIINPAGVSAAQKAATQQGVSNNINTLLYNVKGQSGGNVGRYLSNALNPQISNSTTQLAIADANLKNQNMNLNIGRSGQVAQQFQSIADRNIQNKLNRRMMMLQGYGNSVLQNKRFKNQAIEGMSSDLLGGGLNLLLGAGGGKAGGNKFNPSFKPPTYESMIADGFDPNYVDPSLNVPAE